MTEAIVVFQRMLGQLGEAPSVELAKTLSQLGQCYRDSGQPDLAERQQRESLRVLAGLEVTDETKSIYGNALTILADILRKQGRFPEARQAYEEGLVIYRALGHLRGQGISLNQLGTLAMLEGNLKEASQRHGAALALFRQLGEPRSEAVAWHQLGIVFEKMEQLVEAERCHRVAARIREEAGLIGGADGAITSWNQLALISGKTGKSDAAESWYWKAIEACRKFKFDTLAWGVLSNLSQLLASQPGRLGEARELAEEALAIKRTLDPGGEEIWQIYSILAGIADRDSRPAEAREYWRLAREAKRNRAENRNELRQHASLIAAAVMAAQEERHRVDLEESFPQLEQNGWTALVAAIRRVLVGERNEEELCDGLDLEDSMIVIAILRALEDPSTLDDLLGDSEPA